MNRKYRRSTSYVGKSSSLRMKQRKKITNNKQSKKNINRNFSSYIQCLVLPKVQSKEKLTLDEQVQYLKYKGITFNIYDESKAKIILSDTNYYYKLSVARKLFDKDYTNRYINLDFGLLVDLSSIDMGIRYLLLQMCLDIEHSLKAALNSDLSENPKIDPYIFVQQFRNKNRKFYNQTVDRFSRTKYMKQMYNKRGGQIPIWVLLEISDMGGLLEILKFYVKKNNKSSNLVNASKILLYAKNIRNTCAHSNPFIYNIFNDDMIIHPRPNPVIVTYGTTMKIDSKDIPYQKVHDLIALFFLHKIFCSNSLNERRVKEGFLLMERTERRAEYYCRNTELIKTKKIFNQLLDYLDK
ncbi:Abi family protein [Vagococcus fluvialis]|uniref:Abi family protein n=1 Tax=Vagococcus fluvialis TaxID=2738 RepID=UPI0037CE2AC6